MRKLIPGAVEERVSRREVDESDWYQVRMWLLCDNGD